MENDTYVIDETSPKLTPNFYNFWFDYSKCQLRPIFDLRARGAKRLCLKKIFLQWLLMTADKFLIKYNDFLNLE